MKKVLIVLLVLLILVVGIGFVMPTDYAVAKSVTISGSPDQVHTWVGDLNKWDEWIPWVENDPSIKTTRDGKTTGVGAHQSWTSDSGDGELTFTASDPQTGIAYDMAFIMGETRMPSSATMKYEKVDGGTKVTWSMDGDMDGAMGPVLDGWFRMFMPMMIGKDFDKGLNKLKAKVEAGS